MPKSPSTARIKNCVSSIKRKVRVRNQNAQARFFCGLAIWGSSISIAKNSVFFEVLLSALSIIWENPSPGIAWMFKTSALSAAAKLKKAVVKINKVNITVPARARP